MTEAEQTARAVLAAASLVDHRIREPDPHVIKAWAALLGDIDRRAALDAVKRHYQRETRVLLPHDVLYPATANDEADRHPSYRPAREVLAELERRHSA